HAHVIDEPDHVRPDEARFGGTEGFLEALDDLRLALVDEHVRPPHRANVERLVARVQDENMLQPGRKVPAVYDFIARSTASCSSGESATGERPSSISFT